MARKLMAWHLPEIVHPPTTKCFQIQVPNEIYHLTAFYGAIYLLSKWYAWQEDEAHTAKEVAAVWRDIFDDLLAGNCTIPVPPGSAGAEGDDNLIRQNPDNPCELQTSIDGTNWCTFADLSLCQPAPNQPGTGSEQPQPGGGCATYHGVMGASGPWYVPTVVNTGDTIEILRADGVTNDGGTPAWRAPDGGLFFAGSNTGLTTTEGGDPLPAVPHLKLIASIDGSFYDIYPGVFTVPSVAANSQVLLLVNDDPLSNNAGQITFDVQVCNNQAGAWTSVLDFTLSPFATIITPAFAPWTLGIGFEGAVNGGVPNFCQIDMVIPSFTLEGLALEYHCDSVGGTSQLVEFLVNSGAYGTPAAPVAGGTQLYPVLAEVVGVTAITIVLSSGTTGGPDKMTKLTISGKGTKPSILP